MPLLGSALTTSFAVPVLVPLASPAACSSADGPLTGRTVSAAIVDVAGAVVAGAGAEATLCAQAGSPQTSNAVNIANKHGLSHAEHFIASLLSVFELVCEACLIF